MIKYVTFGSVKLLIKEDEGDCYAKSVSYMIETNTSSNVTQNRINKCFFIEYLFGIGIKFIWLEKDF